MVYRSRFLHWLSRFRRAGSAAFVLIIGSVCGCGGGDDSPGPAPATPHEFFEITVTTGGGDFSLPNGLGLSIPPGAVAGETTLRFRTLEQAELQIPTDFFRQMNTQVVAAFEARPAGLSFSRPVSVRFTDPADFAPSSLIYPLTASTTAGAAPAMSRGRPTAGLASRVRIAALEDYTVDLSTVTVNADGSIDLPDLSSLPAETRAILLMALEEVFDVSECQAIPCRCGAIRIESDDFDSASTGNNGCYSAYSDGFVHYLDCPQQPVEPWSLHEADLDITVTPDNASIKVEGIAYFSFALSDERGQPVTGFAIESLSIDDPAVITDINIGTDSIGIKGLAVGIATAEVVVRYSGCQYKSWFTVEVEPRKVIAPHRISIPEGDHAGLAIRLSDPPPSDRNVIVAAFVDGDEDISIVGDQTLSFTPANWNLDQILLVAAAEDDGDASNGEASITLLVDDVLFESGLVTATEVDNDRLNFLASGVSLAVPEGGRAALHFKLNIEPDATVTTTATLLGDPSIAHSGGALSFDSSNWDSFQPMLFSASADADCDSGVATLTLGDSTATIPPLVLGISEIEIDHDCDNPPGGGGGGDDDDDPTIATYSNQLYIQGSKANWNGTRARWWGVVPIQVTQPLDSLSGAITGSGTLAYSNSYSWLSYPHAGYEPWYELVECHYRETGWLSVQMSGNRYEYPGVLPEYLATAHYTRHITMYEQCADGFYWTEDSVDDFGSRQFSLWGPNGYIDYYSDPSVFYLGELLDKSNL